MFLNIECILKEFLENGPRFWSVDYWLIWQFLRWFIPRSSLFNSTRECVCNQSTDFLPL